MERHFHRDHFLDPAAHAAVNRYVQITASYINLFLAERMLILDVGGADGIIQEFLLGKVKSIDIDPASERVKEGTIFDEPDDTYDAVIYNHVLEHIWRSYEEIGAATKKLKRGGILFIACPYHTAPWAYNTDAHIQLFDEHNLSLLVREHGLKVVEYSRHCFRDDKEEQWLVAKKI